MTKTKREMRQEAIKRLKDYISQPSHYRNMAHAFIGDEYFELMGEECVSRVIGLLTDDEQLTEDDYLALLQDAARDYVRTQTYYKGLLRGCNRFCEDNYMQLPVDADGEVIELWDKITYHGPYSRCRDRVFEVRGYCASGRTIGAVFVNCDGDYVDLAAKECHHHYKPTIEDVLREFAIACEDAGNAGPEVQRLAGEYAKKLQLKEEGCE